MKGTNWHGIDASDAMGGVYVKIGEAYEYP